MDRLCAYYARDAVDADSRRRQYARVDTAHIMDFKVTFFVDLGDDEANFVRVRVDEYVSAASLFADYVAERIDAVFTFAVDVSDNHFPDLVFVARDAVDKAKLFYEIE